MMGSGRRYMSTSAPRSSSKSKRTVYVKIEGEGSFAEVKSNSKATVADLTKEIIKELPSLAKVNPSAITLHVATDDTGHVAGAALDARKSLADAGVGNSATIIAKVPAYAGAPAIAASNKLGERLTRVVLCVITRTRVSGLCTRCSGCAASCIRPPPPPHANHIPLIHVGVLSSIFELPALSDTDVISQAVAAIRNGEVKEGSVGADGKQVDVHLRLPAGLRWPIATNNALFVRKYYAPLLENVLGWCTAAKPDEPDSEMRRIVTGQPGIGKSVWM
jgi:hypothetical protein